MTRAATSAIRGSGSVAGSSQARRRGSGPTTRKHSGRLLPRQTPGPGGRRAARAGGPHRQDRAAASRAGLQPGSDDDVPGVPVPDGAALSLAKSGIQPEQVQVPVSPTQCRVGDSELDPGVPPGPGPGGRPPRPQTRTAGDSEHESESDAESA